MASRFVSAGVMVAATGEATQNDPPTTTTTDTTTTTTTTTKTTSGSKKKAEWVAVTAQLESERRQREAARLHQQQQQGGSQQPEKSLYEVLQANKAAKQAAFEEAHRLRNQFRALEEDEVQFLEEVRERKRREEEEARREVERGLQAFKEAQRKGVAAGGYGAGEGDGEGEVGGEGEGEGWGFGEVGRKRRMREAGGRGKKRLKGVGGLKRSCTGGEGETEGNKKGKESEEKREEDGGVEERPRGKGEVSQAKESNPAAASTTQMPAQFTSTGKSGGLLVDYGSSDAED